MHPKLQSIFDNIGMKGVSDDTTIGALTAKAHGLTMKGGKRKSRSRRRKRKSCRKSRSFW